MNTKSSLIACDQELGFEWCAVKVMLGGLGIKCRSC